MRGAPPILYWVCGMRFLTVMSDPSVSLFSVVVPVSSQGAETLEMTHGWDLIVTGVQYGSEVRVGEQWYPIEPGKTLCVPRQTPHAFRHPPGLRGHFYVASRPGGLELYLEKIGKKEIATDVLKVMQNPELREAGGPVENLNAENTGDERRESE